LLLDRTSIGPSQKLLLVSTSQTLR
jgi:hypothetical protein